MCKLTLYKILPKTEEYFTRYNKLFKFTFIWISEYNNNNIVLLLTWRYSFYRVLNKYVYKFIQMTFVYFFLNGVFLFLRIYIYIHVYLICNIYYYATPMNKIQHMTRIWCIALFFDTHGTFFLRQCTRRIQKSEK